jgi:hypothetical protein
MNMYLINALLILLVIRQIREHQLDARALAVPVLAVAAAAVMFLHSVPGGGSDIALDLACVSAGAAMGAIGGLATRLRLGAEGRPLGRAGTLAAVPEPASGPHSPAPSPIGRRRPRRLIPATPRPVSARYRADVIGPPACTQPTPGLVPASTGTCTGGRICRS